MVFNDYMFFEDYRFYAIFSKKRQNTVLGYKKGSKSKSEKSDRSANPTLYIVSLYDFPYKSVWIDLKENLDFSLLFYAIFSKKYHFWLQKVVKIKI